MSLLTVSGLTIARTMDGTALVHDLGFSVASGEVLAIVGESGSGKTLSVFAIAGLLPPALHISAGQISLAGEDILALDPATRRTRAGSRIGMVFQDPLSSFNPVRRIGTALIESAMRHQGLSHTEARARATAQLTRMQLPEPERMLDAYPHQLSGGQRQRVMIALALINEPALLIADEPTTALDPTVQRAILRLLKAQAPSRATILITHDLGVAASLATRIMVMRDGRCLESGPTAALLAAPSHDYTRQLIAARTGLLPA
jgi:ABC-type glutathione transport system ATPase component